MGKAWAGDTQGKQGKWSCLGNSKCHIPKHRCTNEQAGHLAACFRCFWPTYCTVLLNKNKVKSSDLASAVFPGAKINLTYFYDGSQKIRLRKSTSTRWPLAAALPLCTLSAVVRSGIFMISPMFTFRQSLCGSSHFCEHHHNRGPPALKSTSVWANVCTSKCEWVSWKVRCEQAVCVKWVYALLVSMEVAERHFSKGPDKVIFHSGASWLLSGNSSLPCYIKQKGYC